MGEVELEPPQVVGQLQRAPEMRQQNVELSGFPGFEMRIVVIPQHAQQADLAVAHGDRGAEAPEKLHSGRMKSL